MIGRCSGGRSLGLLIRVEATRARAQSGIDTFKADKEIRQDEDHSATMKIQPEAVTHPDRQGPGTFVYGNGLQAWTLDNKLTAVAPDDGMAIVNWIDSVVPTQFYWEYVAELEPIDSSTVDWDRKYADVAARIARFGMNVEEQSTVEKAVKALEAHGYRDAADAVRDALQAETAKIAGAVATAGPRKQIRNSP